MGLSSSHFAKLPEPSIRIGNGANGTYDLQNKVRVGILPDESQRQEQILDIRIVPSDAVISQIGLNRRKTVPDAIT